MNEADEELRQLQQKHREQLAEAREKIRRHKADVRRWIIRGQFIESVCKNPDQVPEDSFERRIKDLISKGIAYENAARGSRDSDRP